MIRNFLDKGVRRERLASYDKGVRRSHCRLARERLASDEITGTNKILSIKY